MDYLQGTLKTSAECVGIGLHSGKTIKFNIHPASPDTGIYFVRTDLPNSAPVKVSSELISDTNFATTISSNGASVGTIEHLMAAFMGLGIDNAIVEIDGPEVPVMDGSSAPFVLLFKNAGIVRQKVNRSFIKIVRPFSISDENDAERSIEVYPSEELQVTYSIDYDHPLLRNQGIHYVFSGSSFSEKLCRARTFGFLRDVEYLKSLNLAKGGSLDNAVVLDDNRVLNEGGLRFDDELICHKVLDFLGDLNVAGAPVIGHFVVKKSGHFFNHKMLHNLLSDTKCWEMVSYGDSYKEHSRKASLYGKKQPVPEGANLNPVAAAV